MRNTGIRYSSKERMPTVLSEMAELLPPLSGEQLAVLEADLLVNGCYAPVIVNEDTAIIRPTPFRIIREIILTDAQYHRFQSDLLAERPYIAARTKLTGYDRETGGFCCLLVTSRNRKDGILVDGEGYHYARYAAYVPNKQALDLRGVVRDNLDLKSKER